MTENPKIAAGHELIAALKNKRRYDTFTLPMCGLTVRFQSLTALERGRHQAATLTKDGNTDQTRIADSDARLIVACLVDENGQRLFVDKETGLVCQFDGSDVAALARVLRRHCGLAVEEEKQADFTMQDSGETLAGD